MSHMPSPNVCHACRNGCVVTSAPGLTSHAPSSYQCPLCERSLRISPGRDGALPF